MYKDIVGNCDKKSGWIDIHCHILPGIDDGAVNKRESLKMLKLAVDEGVRQMIVTPHFHYRRGNAKPEKVRALVQEMQSLLDEKEIPIRLHAGNELYYSHSLLDVVKAGEALTMADSDYILLEFSMETGRRKIQNAIYQFLCEGYNPIIAHAERYLAFLNHPEFAREVHRMGAYLQVNTDSIDGNIGWKEKHLSRIWFKKGYVTFLATDAHDAKKRTPRFEKTAKWIGRKYGEDQVWEYLAENPEKILENKSI